MPQPFIELGGNADKPTLHIAPANGFVPQTYIPLLRPFFEDYHVVCLPPRALWGEGDPPPLSPDMPGWEQVADDLLAGFAQYNLDQVVAVGHSLGGVASMLALLQDASRFKALILLDPTILTPAIIDQMRISRERGVGQHPLAQMALKRRAEFADVEETFAHYRSKILFANWPDETLRLYAEYGTMPADEGLILTWPPAWEAHYFSTGYVDTWQELPKLRDVAVPILFVNGGNSDTFIPESAAKVRDMLPDATYRTVAGQGHLFPHSAPAITASIMREWLQQQGLG